ncbi:transglycosylase SLT domain-containing protein [Microbaculum sp. FT89]|uniref:lytic transglycosylase domain-containing protein n=1 Tax=Microbaculum sp. FT89 TaxID=3447298 RepID=UPI003F52A937
MSIPRLVAIGLAAGAFVAPGTGFALTASDIPLPRERPGSAATKVDAAEVGGTETDAAETDSAETDAAETEAIGTDTSTADAEIGDDTAPGPDFSSNGIALPRQRPAEAGPRFGSDGALGAVADDATATAVREAVNHISARRFDAALAIKKKISDPAARTLIEFLYVRDYSLSAPYSRIADFLDNNPDWPNRELIRKRFEVALLAQRAKPDAVIAAFEDEAPLSSAGTIVFASALDKAGSLDRARAMIRALWRSASLTQGEEKLILERFGKNLTSEDHKARMDRLLYKGETSAALRAAKKLGGNELKLAEARIAVIRRSKAAGSALDKLPDASKKDPGYLLSKVQWYRRTGKETEAAKLLLSATFDDDKLVDPDEWALERRIIARELIEEDNAKAAYDLVSTHAAVSPIDQLENEWHAGWIALRFLKDAETAKKHFAELKTIATTPISQARAEYWLGRAAEEGGEPERALEHYLAAGAFPTTYYGQLALDRVGRNSVPAPDKPLLADTARRIINERDSVRAMRLLAQIGEKDRAARYMISMANETDDPLTLVGLAETAQRMGMKWGTVWIGKRGSQAGAPTDAYAFSTDGMPDYPKMGAPIDPAVVYAIARQESVFNPEAVSPAGARGLMQMMPATAKATARSVGQPYDLKRLTADPRYNATLGAAHLGELADYYDNAYALVFAAYNAGPGRVSEWVERFGDPRKGEIDPVDWVELIPFNETRNYVQRVMEGLQVYRASLGGSQKLLIADDLRLPIGYGNTMIAVENSIRPGGIYDSGVPGVFSGFGNGPLDTGGAPTTALGFGEGH